MTRRSWRRCSAASRCRSPRSARSWSRRPCPPTRCVPRGGGCARPPPPSCRCGPAARPSARWRWSTPATVGRTPPWRSPPRSRSPAAARWPLDNARLHGQQLKVAETLQHSLLSPPPQPDHLQIAVRYRPAAVHQQVGGDWYDAFVQPNGATLLVIGDVVGHNVDAAAAMGQIRAFLRGIAYDRPETPAQVLTRVDGVL